MKLSESGYVRATLRELAVLSVATVGAFLFFIHSSLYLEAGTTARPLNLGGFLLVTTILYLFLRLIISVAGLYYPRPRPEYVVCPECGKALEDGAVESLEHHRRVTLSPRPTEKEVMAAIMLRKAIDDARRTAQKNLSGPKDDVIHLPGNVENLPVPVDEFERMLRGLDRTGEPRGSERRRPGGPRGPSP
jgi:hypothetical protein